MSKKANVERLKEEVKARGGKLWISDQISQEAADAFLESVLDCPLCTELEARQLGNTGAAVTPGKMSH